MFRRLQPYVPEAATLCSGGCNPMCNLRADRGDIQLEVVGGGGADGLALVEQVLRAHLAEKAGAGWSTVRGRRFGADGLGRALALRAKAEGGEPKPGHRPATTTWRLMH